MQEELKYLGKEKIKEGLKYCSWEREGVEGSEIVWKERVQEELK